MTEDDTTSEHHHMRRVVGSSTQTATDDESGSRGSGRTFFCPSIANLNDDRDRALRAVGEHLAETESLPPRQCPAVQRRFRDLVDTQRLLDGSLSLHLQPQPILPLVESALATIQPDANSKGVGIEQAIAAPGAVANLDSRYFPRALVHVLENAVTFTSRSGRACIRLSRRELDIRIDVLDTGRGLGNMDASAIFRPFVRGRTHDKRLGLGLTIARGVVELHGGELTAQSGAPDFGAIFTIRVPALENT